MFHLSNLRSTAITAIAAACLSGPALAADTPKAVDIPAGNLATALDALAKQTGVELMYSSDQLRNMHTNGVRGTLTAKDAAEQLLPGTQLKLTVHPKGALLISDASMLDSKDGILLAQAQTGGQGLQGMGGDDVAPKKTLELDEIVVTARRRVEKSQTVPIAVTTIDQGALERNNIQTVADLQYLVPSLTASPVYSRDGLAMNIRGQGVNGVSSSPGVLAYLNEVQIPNVLNGELGGGPGLLFDLENVQILKGPQGTLFGGTSVGGALLLQTARPKNEFGARFQVGYGNYNDREADGVINIPIVQDKVLTRFAFNAQKRDGFTHVQSTPSKPNGVDANDRDFWAVRGSLTLRPVDGLQNDTIVTYTKYNSNGDPFVLNYVEPRNSPTGAGFLDALYGQGGFFASPTGPYPNDLLAQQRALGAREIVPTTELEASGKFLGVQNITSYDLTDNLTVRNIFGYARAEMSITTNFGALVFPLFSPIFEPAPNIDQQHTEEVQLQGKHFDGALNWVLGGYYYNKSNSWNQIVSVFVPVGTPPAGNLQWNKYESKAVYGQGTYDLSALVQNLKLTAGMRYSWDDKRSSVIDCPVGAGGQSHLRQPGCNTEVEQLPSKSEAPTWTLGLDYQITPETLLYATTRRGYRPGGSNGTIPQTGEPIPPYGAEHVTDYELGVKSDFHVADVPVRVNLDVYRQKYDKVQFQINQVEPTFSYFYTVNSAAAKASGVELETWAKLTADFEVGVMADYLKFKYTTSDLAAFPVDTLNAQKPGGQPKYKFAANAKYRLPLAEAVGDVSVQAQWTWQDEYGDPTQPEKIGLIPSFGLLNGGIDWRGVFGKPIDASFFISNALNKTYPVQRLGLAGLLGIGVEKYGLPRFYGVRVGYHFGEM